VREVQLVPMSSLRPPPVCPALLAALSPRAEPSGRGKSALLLLPILLCALLAPATARAAVFPVTSANNNGGGTLRQAITNANGSAGADTIVFNILPAGTYTINLNSALPAITEAVTIDGTTQPGYVAGGPPRIELNGAGAGGVIGLDVNAGVSVTIKSLCINRFTTGIR
jgi:hypothetical protein